MTKVAPMLTPRDIILPRQAVLFSDNLFPKANKKCEGPVRH